MTDLRKAAEMALEFVEWLCSDDHSVKPKNNALKTREALRQALAESANSTTDFVEPKASFQPEQNPVGYVTNSGTAAYLHRGVYLEDDTPLYTAPPRKRSFSEDVGRLLSTGKGFYDDGTPIDPKKINMKIEGVGDGVVTCTEVHLPRPPQEPVGYAHVDDLNREHHDFWVNREQGINEVPLYTAPPRREWVGIHEDELRVLAYNDPSGERLKLAKAVEAKLREKNQ